MNLITLEESVWKELLERINMLIATLQETKNQQLLDDLWLNHHDVCQYLHLSEKTLWRMRKNNEITYSKVYGQYFYTLGSIRSLLDVNAIQSTEVYIEELIQKAKTYVEKARHIR